MTRSGLSEIELTQLALEGLITYEYYLELKRRAKREREGGL